MNIAAKYNAANAMTIFKAKLVPKEAERRKDFHSREMKCFIIVCGLWFVVCGLWFVVCDV